MRRTLKTETKNGVMDDVKYFGDADIADIGDTESSIPTPGESRPILFENANAPKDAHLSPGMAGIVETIFIADADLKKEYLTLEQELLLGKNLVESSHVLGSLDRAETNFRKAHRLWVTAKLERERWDNENEVVCAPLKLAAQKELEKEKELKIRTKAITEADVAMMLASMFPDEWNAAEERRMKVKLAEESLGNLVEAWSSRCRTLQVLGNKR